MIKLIRNCLHGSEISTYLETDELGNPHAFIKASSSANGIDDLKKEAEGWKWYLERRKVDRLNFKCTILQEKQSYFKIKTNFIAGRQPKYTSGLVNNYEIIDRLLKHYIEIWGKGENIDYPMHGDLSLDNIIYDDENIFILDWEHFQRNSMPWGFDAIYLIFETLYFSLKKRMPNKKEIEIISGWIKFLINNCIGEFKFYNSPLYNLINSINSNAKLWSSQFEKFNYKLPVVTLPEEIIEYTDTQLNLELEK